MGAGVIQSEGGGSRRRRRGRKRPMSEINVTPFVDVMLVLLIIFMVAAPLLTVGIEVDMPESVRDAVARRGITWGVVNPWNWHHGSFEGIHIDPETGEMAACGDPRRTAQALPA